MDSSRNNSSRGGRGSGRGRGGDARGTYQNQGGRGGGNNNRSQSNQGGGRGSDAPPHRGPQATPQQAWANRPPVQENQPPPQQAWGNRPPAQANQPPRPQQAWVNRPPVQGNQPPPQQVWGNRPPAQANQPPRPQQAWANRPPVQANQTPPQQAWGNRPPAQANQPPRPQQAWVNRPPVQGNPPPPQQVWGNRPPAQANQPPRPQQAWVNRPPTQVNQPPRPQQAWGNRPTAPQQSASSSVDPSGASAGQWGSSAPLTPVQPGPSLPVPHQTSADEIDLQSLKISENKTKDDEIQVIKRPDAGGIISIKNIGLLVNHFPVEFNRQSTIIHYDVTVKPTNDHDGSVKKKLRKFEMALIRDKLFSEDDRFKSNALLKKCVYDSEKSIYSAVILPTGKFTVNIDEGEDVKRGSYTFTITEVKRLKLSTLKDYMSGNQPYIPRDILQWMDLVMKDNPSRSRINVGRSYYANQYQPNHDLKGGVAAYRGFHHSLKPTSSGLSLCLDYSVIAFRKPWPVIDFLKENVRGFGGPDDVRRLKKEVCSSLRGLKVRVTHRRTKQKYTVGGLSDEDAHDCYFDLVDPEGTNPPRRTSLVDYFREKWGKDIMHPNVPCLELGRTASKSNKVPMEFCELVEGQRFPKENLDREAGMFLKNLSLAKPSDRLRAINEMVRANDGPCGDVTRNFGIEVDMRMTKVTGRVIGPPVLKLGNSANVNVDAEKCQWNLLGKTLVDGRSIDRWALIDFTSGTGNRYELQGDAFVENLMLRCQNLRINMKKPLVHRICRMQELSSVNRLENLLKGVVNESGKSSNRKEKLQLIVCVMTRKDPGYRYLKWVSETKIGVITQCCLSSNANKGQNQYLANLCLKINAKLGGSNFELHGELLHFDTDEHVMFIGADVNHPAARNTNCPSIAAVVGTVNWPAANRYAARVSPQAHRCETIMNFGTICLDLVNTYDRLNRYRPDRIILFRDGVSDGQFEMVLEQELKDLKNAFGDYKPSITVIVAQKRHQTRLFLENKEDGGRSGNVPPGTVVDTDIVHPHNFDFFLCSHYGGLGTSKPTHYYVLWDENFFTSDKLQKLIYDMCFTYARCTKPISLVPPVYYADLVAYRGRMFQEVLLETASSSRHASSSGDASFDQSFYNLHSNLKDIMFFV